VQLTCIRVDALAHRVHISGDMYLTLRRLGGFDMEHRGRMSIKVLPHDMTAKRR